ncbi:MAG: arginine--tRNA ligase [Patescibacteria group bacterium]
MKEKLEQVVAEALLKLGAPETSFVVEWPADLSHGDYATNAALASAKALSRNPKELAEELAELLRSALGDLVSAVTVAGPGFINITLTRSEISKEVERATVEKKNWGSKRESDRPRVMIEYSNPNPFKELHIGHLMSNVLGEALSRLTQASGAHVIRDTFGGDVGPHVAKALWKLQQDGVADIGNAKEIGTAYAEGARAYEESEETKAEIDALNTRIYDVVGKQNTPEILSKDDRALLELWRKGRQISMEEFGRLFHLLGTSFDYVFYDSDTTEPGMRMVQSGLKKGIFEKSEGAIIYRGEKVGLNTLVFITSRGTPTYETKDIGLSFLKEERAATDEVIIITAVEQIGHFKVFLAALSELAPTLAGKTKHLPHGLLRLTEGKMGSRQGNVITAASLIEDMTKKALAKNEDPLIAEQVAIGAIKYMILRQAPGGDIIFDPEKSLSLEGDSGPYLQYALVRARSVLSKSDGAKDMTPPNTPYTLERLVLRFPEVVANAYSEKAPQQVTSYLTLLASEWNSFYAQERIIGDEYEGYKLLLAEAFATTMENGLRLLGIPTPERM